MNSRKSTTLFVTALAPFMIMVSLTITMQFSTPALGFMDTHYSTISRTNVDRSTIMTTALNAESQAEYGKSLDMPSTYVTCGQCGSSYALKMDDLGGGKGR